MDLGNNPRRPARVTGTAAAVLSVHSFAYRENGGIVKWFAYDLESDG